MTDPSPATGPRFVCDAMLHRLARWLRAAGHDTEIAEIGEHDGSVLARAVAEDRLLVTRDRGILGRRGAEARTILIAADRVQEQARELSAMVPVDWLARAFTRCTVCNAPLAPAGPERLAEVPETVRRRGLAVHACRGCGRLYWAGGHEERMRRTLEAFAGRGPA